MTVCLLWRGKEIYFLSERDVSVIGKQSFIKKFSKINPSIVQHRGYMVEHLVFKAEGNFT